MATFCVNTNSANFQNLVNEYNIDPLSLEVTIFQWMKDNDKVWSEENNSELRDYIENEYSINKVFNVESKEMFDAYSKLYDAVSQTGSMSKEDALDLYSKVSQVVGDSNVSLYMDTNGNWHVNMKMPSYNGVYASKREKTIKQGIQTLEQIFGKDLFGLNEEINLDQAIEALSKNNKITPLVNLLKFAKQNVNSNTVIRHKNKVFDKNGVEVDGLYDAENDAIVLSENSSKPIARVLTHEMLHSLFIDRLNKDSEIRKNLENIINKAKKELGETANSIYGLTSPEEFISELFTDENLVKKLSEIKGSKRKPINKFIKDVYQWFEKCLKRIFTNESTLLDDALYEIEKLLNTSDRYSKEEFRRWQDIISKKVLNTREYDANYVRSKLQDIVNEFPQFFNNNNIDDFIVRGKDDKYHVIAELKNKKHLFANLLTTNANLRKLRNSEYASLEIAEEKPNPNQKQEQQLDLFEQQKEEIKERVKQQEETAKEIQKAVEETGATPVTRQVVNPLKQEFDNLRARGKGFPLEERRHVAKVVVNYVSSIIDNIKKYGIDYANQIFSDSSIDAETVFAGKNLNFKDVDFQSMSRKDIINKVGLMNIITYVKEKYINPDLREIEDERIEENLRTAYDNFNAILMMANKDLVLCEGYTVETGYKNVTYNDETNEIQGDFQTDQQELGETEAWNLRERSVSAKNSMSQVIRRMIRRTPVYKNGEPQVDNYGYGFDLYCNPDTLMNTLLDKCSKCSTMTQMRSVLRQNKVTFPEFEGILKTLDNNKEFADKFFSNFCKDQTTFAIAAKMPNQSKNGNVEFGMRVINAHTYKDDFDSAIVEKKYFGEWQLWPDTDGNIKNTLDKAVENSKRLVEISESLRKTDDNTQKAALLKEGLAIAGVDATVSDDAIAGIINDKSSINTIAIAFKTLNTKLSGALKTYNSLSNKKDFGSYNPLAYKGNQLGQPLEQLANAIQDFVPLTIEPSAYENGKSYYAYNNPSFIGVLKRKIKDTEQFEKLCKEEFQMTKFFYDPGSGLWYNDWLRLMQDDSKRKLFDHSVVLGFNGENYIDMGVSAFEATCILNYFASPEDNFAWYKVPIPSDKNSFEFIKFVKLKYQKDPDLYDSNPFLESFRNNVSQEIMRINTVLQRSFNKNFANVDYFDIKKNTFEGSFENLTIDDYIEHLDDLENTGAVFTFFPFITDEIRNKTVLGKQIFKKIKGEELDDDATYSKNILTAIDSYMRKLEDAEIQNFRKHGLFEYEIIRKKDSIGGNYNAVQNRFLSKLHDSYGQVANSLRKGNNLLEGLTAGAIINDQNENNIIENLTEYQKNELQRRNILVQNGNELVINHNKAPYGESIYNAIIADEMSNQVEDKLREYVWGNYYGRLNIIQLTVTDPAYFGNIINFQKRFAMTHSPGIRMNIEAQINGESVTDGYGRSMTLPDNIVSSETVKNEVVKIFQKQAEKTQGAEREFYLQCAKDAITVFTVQKDKNGKEKGGINQTDAQAYTCPTAMRKKLAMIGEWSDAQEDAYQQIRNKNNSFELAKEILKVTKPFVGGTTIAYSGGAMVNMRNPIQHKNSEYMLLLANALAESQGEKTILGEIYRFMESTHWDGNSYKRNGIDTIQFKSAVKVGGTALTDIQDLPVENIEKALNIYAFNDNGEYNPAYVTKYNYEYYSFQQEVPNHFQDHEQLIGSQQRILAVADQNPDYELEINGKKITARDAIKKYFDLHANNIYASQNELLAELLIDNAAFTDDLNRLAKKAKGETLEERTKAFTRILKNNYKLPESLTTSITDRFIANNGEGFKDGDIAVSNADKKYVLSKLLQDSISNDAKFDSDILVGCQLDDVTGDFIIPLSDPIQSAKIQQLLFSLVKNRINKQKTLGGPAVQVSSYGISENLETKFKTDSKGNRVIDHMQVYVTCPTTELEAKLMKKDKDGNYIRMYTVEEALRKHLLTDDDLKMIGYRIPTEDTYSIIPLKIKGFLPRFAGDAIMLPADHVAITGSDFDIDKFYLIRKGNAYNSRQRRNNDIFDIEYAMLQTPESTEKMFNAGNFDSLKKLSRNIASKKGFDNIQYNIMTQSADSYFYEQNTAAKKLIGIMANGTTSHAFLALQNIHVKFNMPFSYKGREITELKLDPERNFEGKPVSKVLGSTVGAAADAAKEPVFKNLNITPATAGVAEFLWRTGFPESFVAYFLAQPILVDCVNEYTMRSSYENVSLRTVIKDKITEKTGNFTNAAIEKAAKIELSRRDFSEDEFERHLNYHTLDIPALYLMYSLLDSAHDLNELTFMTKFNSMTNAAGPTISEMLATERRIHKFIDTYNTFITEGEGIDLPEDVIKNNSMLKAFYETTVGTAGDIVTDQLENGSVYKIFQPYFQHYSPAFKSVLEVFDRTTKTSADADTIEDLFKFFMLYNATISHTYNNKVVLPVIDGSNEARKKYASKNFVKKVIDSKNNSETTNDFLKLYHVTEKTNRIPMDTVDTDVNGGSSDFNEQIRGTWTDMLSNEKTGSLAMELMKYSIYRSGFKYSPKTPLHLSTVDLKLALEGYTDMLNATIMESMSPEEVANVIEQFKRNNSNNPNTVPVIYKSAFKNSGFTEKNEMLIITDSDKNLLSLASYSDDNETVFTSMIKYKDNLYKLAKKTGTADSRSLTYKKIGKLGIKSNFIEVNGNDNYITSIFENFTEDEDNVKAEDSDVQVSDIPTETNKNNNLNLPTFNTELTEAEAAEQRNIDQQTNNFEQTKCK